MLESDRPNIPLGTYVCFHSGPPAVRTYSIDNYSGDCIVTVHKSLDCCNGSPPVEHVIKRSSFRIGVRGRSAEEFLEEIATKLAETLKNP